MTELVALDPYPELLRYVGMAAVLQDANMKSEHGRDTSVRLVPDALCQWVTIYDVIERRYAGFSNALQQVRLGDDNPKQWQRLPEFNSAIYELSFSAWMYVYLLHRVTGSGASFARDHGFRNSIVADAVRAYMRGATMPDYVLKEMQAPKPRPIFTSIGNQIPAFPKVTEPYVSYFRGSERYIHQIMPEMLLDLHGVLMARGVDEPPLKITEVVDWLSRWHQRQGFSRFLFVHTAFVMDLAEYHPHIVDPMSHCYFGANAEKCAALLFERPQRLKKEAFHDAVMERFQSDVWSIRPDTPGFPMSLEDVLCDGIRWIRNYIPKGYEHLTPEQVESSAPDLLGRHPSYYRHLESWEHGVQATS